MALTNRTEGHVLPCGRLLEDLWDRITGSRPPAVDEHELACPHCRTARASLEALAAATEAVYADQSLVAPAGLRGKIMDAVRAEIRRVDRLPLPAGELGPVDVSQQAVAAVLRFAADTVVGVRARRCRLHPVPDGVTGPAPAGTGSTSAAVPAAATVEMSIAIRFGPGTSAAAVDAVRVRVRAAAEAQVGLVVGRIDIEVEDVYVDEGPDR